MKTKHVFLNAYRLPLKEADSSPCTVTLCSIGPNGGRAHHCTMSVDEAKGVLVRLQEAIDKVQAP